MKEGKLKKRVQGSQGKPLLFTELKAEQGSTEPEVPTEQTALISESGALLKKVWERCFVLTGVHCLTRCPLGTLLPNFPLSEAYLCPPDSQEPPRCSVNRGWSYQCPSLAPIAVLEIMTISNLRKKVYFCFHLIVHHEGKSGQEFREPGERN